MSRKLLVTFSTHPKLLAILLGRVELTVEAWSSRIFIRKFYR